MKIQKTNHVFFVSNYVLKGILFISLFVIPNVIHTGYAQSEADQSTLKYYQGMLESKVKYNVVCDNRTYNAQYPLQMPGGGTVMTNAYLECQTEMRHCGNDRDRKLYEDMIDDPTYQRCAKAFWRYVEIGRIDLINKMAETYSYVPEDPLRGQNTSNSQENNSANTQRDSNQPSQNTSSGNSGGQDDSFDIDDLSAEDIDIMDVKPEEPTPVSNQELYCPCKGGDRELYGLCITPGGETYFQGEYPWTEDCYLTKGLPKQ